MPTELAALQTRFAASLLAGDAEAAPLIRSGKLSATRRLEIYRHNVLSNLRGALADIFPAVKSIVGDDFFFHACDEFIRLTPSRSGDLNRFGGEWPAFLAAYPYAQDLPHLPDVARLEWAWHESFHAAEHAPLDLSRLAAVPAERHGELRFVLHPAARLLRSPYPLLRLWITNQPGYEGDMAIDWQSGEEYLLVSREGVQVAIRSIAAASWRWLAGLADGETLEQAAEAAFEQNPEFDLQGFLVESVQSAVIVNFSME